MGRRRKGRAVNGILLLDKARGLTSNRALQEVRRLFDAAKAGHTGSLDPLADGMLPICFGEATKLSGYLLDANKTYETWCQFGIKTDSGDADGEVVERCDASSVTEAALREASRGLLGESEQIPPMYSAVKHEGKRLYELARAGQEVERKPREIRIDEFELLAVDGDRAHWRIACSKGTYVRTLIEDLAAAVGTLAHVIELRRTAVQPFGRGRMFSFEELQAMADDFSVLDEVLLPMNTALQGWPSVALDADAAYYFKRGQAIQVPKAPTRGRVAVFGPSEHLLGIGEILLDGRVGPRRLLEVVAPA